MTARFEVLFNGEHWCTSGIGGDGVLGVSVDHTDRKNAPDYHVHIGGLASLEPTNDTRHHVRWPVPDIRVGDEITIRVLPPYGEFDDPIEKQRTPSANMNDDVFGSLEFNGFWDGDIAFDFGSFENAHVHLAAPKTGPTSEQKEIFLGLKARFEVVWPKVADALVKCHAGINTIEELNQKISSRICIDFDGTPDEVSLTFRFAGDEEAAIYFVVLRDYEIVEVGSAD